MLKGISPILTPALLKIIAEMGHGDELVLADGNFPAASIGKRCVRMDGHGGAEVMAAPVSYTHLDVYKRQGPLVLHAAHLRAILVEKHRAHAARARVNGHQGSVCHDSFPSVSISLRLYRTGYAAPAWLPSSFSAVRSSVMSTSRYCPISAA